MQPFRDMQRSPEAFETMVDQSFGDNVSSAMWSRLLSNDLEAMRALTQDRESNADVLRSMTMPCLVFVGELDPRVGKVRECASKLPNATLFTLPECDHIGALLNSDVVIPHIKAFLSNVRR